MHDHPAPDRFRYDAYELDPVLGQVTCRYSVGQRHFFEQVTFGPGGDWSAPAVDAAARLLFLLAGVSYYKTSAPPSSISATWPPPGWSAASCGRSTSRGWPSSPTATGSTCRV